VATPAQGTIKLARPTTRLTWESYYERDQKVNAKKKRLKIKLDVCRWLLNSSRVTGSGFASYLPALYRLLLPVKVVCRCIHRVLFLLYYFRGAQKKASFRAAGSTGSNLDAGPVE
jgi:hypothetical protein